MAKNAPTPTPTTPPAAPAAPSPAPAAPTSAPADPGSILERAFSGAPAKTILPDLDPETPPAPTPAVPPTEPPVNGVLDALNKSVGVEPPAATPPAAPEPDDLSEDDINKAPKQQQPALRAMNAKLKEMRAQLKEAQKKSQAAPESTQLTEEVARLKAQLDEGRQAVENYEKELFVTRLEATQRYQEAVAKPMDKIRTEVQGLAEKYSVDSRALVEALAEPDARKRNERLSELGGEMIEADRIDLYNYGREYAKLESNRQLLTQQSKEALEYIQNMEKTQKEAMTKAQRAEFDTSLNTHWENFQKDLPILRPIEGNAEWNAHIESIITAAKALDIDALPQAQRAAMALQALSMPHAVSVVKLYAQENAALKARLKQYESIEPGTRPSQPVTPVTESPEDANLSMADALRKKAGI